MTLEELLDSGIDFSWNDAIEFDLPEMSVYYEIPEGLSGNAVEIIAECKKRCKFYLESRVQEIMAYKDGRVGWAVLFISVS